MNKHRDDIEYLSAELWRKYRKGMLSSDESTRLKKLCAEDPFFADAWEGMQYTGSGKKFEEDVKTLQAQVHQRTKLSHSPLKSFWRVAAALLLLLVSGYGLYYFVSHNRSPEATATKPDLLSVAGDEKKLAEALYEAPAQVKSLPPQTLMDEVNSRKFLREFQDQKISPIPLPPETVTGMASETEEETRGKEALSGQEDHLKHRAAQTLLPSQAAGAISPVKKSVKAVIQKREVKGYVYDGESHEPVPGANVVIKNTDTGTVSDVNGRFALQIPADRQQLLISSIGYQSKEVQLTQQDSVEVSLSQDVSSLSEVVVTGYGTQAKKHETGAVTSIIPDSLHHVGAGSLRNAAPVSGQQTYKKYLRENLRYPEEARINGIEGTVRLIFTVEPDGSLKDFHIRKSLGFGCDEEAIRLVKEGPSWLPAVKDGITTTQEVKVKVKFKL